MPIANHDKCSDNNEKTSLRQVANTQSHDNCNAQVVVIKMIEKMRNEEITARPGMANISQKMRETRLRWLGHLPFILLKMQYNVNGSSN